MKLIFNIDIKELRERLGNVSQTKFGELFEPPVVYKTIQRWETGHGEKPVESYSTQLLNLYLKSYDIHYKNDLVKMKSEQKQLRKDFSVLYKKVLLLENEKPT